MPSLFVSLRLRCRAALCHQLTGNAADSLRDGSLGLRGNIGFAAVSGFHHGGMDRYLSQKRCLEFRGHFLSATLFKDIDCFTALGADEPAYVFHHAEPR